MDVQQLLNRFDPPIQEIALGLREQLYEAMISKSVQQTRQVVESIDRENIGLGYEAGYKGLVFVITPYRKYVMLGIAGGAKLSDPAGLMQGKGKVHRHIKLYSSSDLKNPELGKLILSAVEAASSG